jgi:hypothetical protein
MLELQKEYSRPLWLHQKTRPVIMGIEEEVQYIGNIFHKIIAEKYQISKKRCSSRYRKPPGH